MPQCPICNAAVWVGQQYCTTCTNPLPHTEGESHYCSQCGIRMVTPHEICQSCKVSLPEMAMISASAGARVWRFPLKVPGIFMGAGLIFLGLLLVFPFKKSPAPTQMLMITPPPPFVEKATAPDPIPASDPVPAAESVPTAPPAAEAPEAAPPPAPAASPTPAASMPSASLPRYFVNNYGLSIREAPDSSSSLIGTLNFKDEVELLETSGSWGKVRDLQRNTVGWAYMRYLQPLAADGQRAVSQNTS